MNKVLKKVKLKPGKYKLRRDSDGKGDLGPVWASIDAKKTKKQNKIVFVGKSGEVRVGCALQVGSFNHWWMTTEITEILEVNEDKTQCRFKTTNSTYTVSVIQ